MAIEKTWCVASLQLSRGRDMLAGVEPRLRAQNLARLDRQLKRQMTIGCHVYDIIWPMRLRRRYNTVNVRLVDPGDAVATPFFYKEHGAWVVETPLDWARVAPTGADGSAVGDFLVNELRRGLMRTARFDPDVEAALAEGLDRAEAHGFWYKDQRPWRYRVPRSDLMTEIGYDRSPTETMCQIKVWRKGRPRRTVTRSIPIPVDAPKVEDANICQCAILDRHSLRFARTGWDGPEQIDDTDFAAIPLAEIEDQIGPVNRIDEPVRLLL